MNAQNILLLYTIASFILVQVAHSLSDDGAASILHHFGWEYRFPTWIVYASILLCTGGSATFDDLLANNGAGYGTMHAVLVGAMTLASSLFGAVKMQHSAQSNPTTNTVVNNTSGGSGGPTIEIQGKDGEGTRTKYVEGGSSPSRMTLALRLAGVCFVVLTGLAVLPFSRSVPRATVTGQGCAAFSKANAPSTILTLEDLACIAENAFVNEADLNVICKFLTGEQQAEARRQQPPIREGIKRMHAKQMASASDGGSATVLILVSPKDAGADGGGK